MNTSKKGTQKQPFLMLRQYTAKFISSTHSETFFGPVPSLIPSLHLSQLSRIRLTHPTMPYYAHILGSLLGSFTTYFNYFRIKLTHSIMSCFTLRPYPCSDHPAKVSSRFLFLKKPFLNFPSAFSQKFVFSFLSNFFQLSDDFFFLAFYQISPKYFSFPEFSSNFSYFSLKFRFLNPNKNTYLQFTASILAENGWDDSAPLPTSEFHRVHIFRTADLKTKNTFHSRPWRNLFQPSVNLQKYERISDRIGNLITKKKKKKLEWYNMADPGIHSGTVGCKITSYNPMGAQKRKRRQFTMDHKQKFDPCILW